MQIRFARTVAALVAAIIVAALCFGPAGGSPAHSPRRTAKIKQTQYRLMVQGKLARMKRARDAARGIQPGPARGKAAREEALLPFEQQSRAEWARQRFQQFRAQSALGSNVKANGGGDVVPGSTQAEVSIAAWRQYVLVAWNDGEDACFPTNPACPVLGYATSTDTGATFIDGGVPPSGTNWTWISDPLVAVNEKSGQFYFVSLADSGGVADYSAFSGVGIVPATFTGTTFNWGTPQMIRKVTSANLLLDKPWAVADSVSDSLYVSYTTFTATGGIYIQFQRSPTGVAWTPAVTLSSGSDSVLYGVQGSRPVVGPLGEIYVVWTSIGPIDVDFFRIKKSTNAGQTFGTQITVPTGGIPSLGFFGNFGSGAPGFNRERGVSFPAIAVDRSTGPNRGRVYVTWNESINFYDDLGGGAGALSEPGADPGNDLPASATGPFTLGNTLRGNMNSSSDFDYWKFNATQGQTAVFSLDSLNASLDLSFRLICSDGTTRLAFSNFGAGQGGIIVFTFPTTATYFVRVVDFNGATGGYRIRSKLSVTGTERARDHRDVFVTTSTNGTTWTTPLRVNTDSGFFDNWLPEVAVSAEGRAYIAWYDWRDAAAQCGGRSHVYMARSDDGGGSWVQLGALSDVASDWTNSASNLAPNQGDYISLVANDFGVFPAWADARNGDPDIYMSYLPLLVTPVQASLLSVDATPQRVTLVWHAAGGEGFPATVYRRTESTDWAAVAQLDVPDNARIVYVDDAVTPGARYQYRFGVVEGGVESFYGETWVPVPRVSLAIASVAPNPAPRELWVSFSLPSAAPATLQLIDIAGRAVRSREVGGAVGAQRLNLAQGATRLPIGIYVVRLTQGGRTVTARASVVR